MILRVNDHHRAAGLVNAAVDRAVDDRGRALLDGQIAGDGAPQTQGAARAHGRVAHDGAVNREVAIDDDRAGDLFLLGWHEASWAARQLVYLRSERLKNDEVISGRGFRFQPL
jgi:hypothetical protein